MTWIKVLRNYYYTPIDSSVEKLLIKGHNVNVIDKDEKSIAKWVKNGVAEYSSAEQKTVVENEPEPEIEPEVKKTKTRYNKESVEDSSTW